MHIGFIGKMVSFINLFVKAMECEIMCGFMFFDQCKHGIMNSCCKFTDVICKPYFELGTIGVLCK